MRSVRTCPVPGEGQDVVVSKVVPCSHLPLLREWTRPEVATLATRGGALDNAEFLRFAEQFKNWGRWGPDDEVGTLNFVTPEAIVQACRLVKKGKVFPLGIPLDSGGPQRQRADNKRFNPVHTMLKTGFDFPGAGTGQPPPHIQSSDDAISMPLQSVTQWDALAHFMLNGKMYNGHPYTMVDGQGAQKNSIDKIRGKTIGRGVLLDFPRCKGVPWLARAEAITAADMDGCARRQKVEVREGDFLLVRTGNLAMYRDGGKGWDDFAGGPRPGLGVSTIKWLHDKRVASVAADNYGVEVSPADVPDQRVTLHPIGIAYMGLLLGEIFDFEKLAEDCAADGVYDFLFVAPPLPVTRGVGSPIDPYAVK